MQLQMKSQEIDVSTLTDDQWFDAVLKSVDENYRTIGDFILPGYPKSELQTLTTKQGASENMLRGAFNLYKHIKGACAESGNELGLESKILDFGCGWGRISRFFTKETAMSNIYGVDVLPALAQACNETYVDGNFLPILQNGTLPHEDNNFDMVFANSVFSHLDEKLNLHWVAEIARVLKPNGIAALTIIDEHKYEKMSSSSSTWFESLGIDKELTRSKLDNGELVWQTTKRKGELEGYGLAITPGSWVQKNWTTNLDYVKSIEKYHQNVIILKKPS